MAKSKTKKKEETTKSDTNNGWSPQIFCNSLWMTLFRSLLRLKHLSQQLTLRMKKFYRQCPTHIYAA